MDEIMSSVPENTQSASDSQDSIVASMAATAVGVAACIGVYYVVRTGIDRRIARQIKKHLKREE